MKFTRSPLAIALIFLSTQCSDFFEIERPPQAPWSSIDEFEQSVIGLYAGLFSGHPWNIAWVNDRIVKTSLGDDVGFVENPEWGYRRNTKEYNVYTERNYPLLYGVISAANHALDFVEQHNGNPYPNETPQVIENNLNRLIGEIHFIRAYAYYVLATTFGHVYTPGGDNSTREFPLHTAFINTVEGARNPKIGTTQEIYDLILDDFKKAKELLPATFIPGVHHSSYEVRANKYAASAMLMRTYFQRGEYDNAKAECDFIIDHNNGAFDLSEDPIEAFNKSSKERGKEVIMVAPFYNTTLPAPNHLSVLNYTWSGGPTGWVETYMAFKTVRRFGWMNDPFNDTTINLVAKVDKRFTQLMKIRLPNAKPRTGVVSEQRASIKNYTTIWTNKYYRGPSGMSTNVPVIRLAEVYLTRSVLRFRAGDRSGAASDLNVVRQRAWDAAIGGQYQPVTGTDITEQMIDDERLIEMFNEADRVDYLRALKKDISLGDRGEGADPYTSENFVWAIPAIELNFNDALSNGS